jgi:DNA-binding transcriptional LysR family regulator
MELRQLEYFVAVAEEANFTRAAERVHISQSGVSAQIRQLERELGAPLIDRSSRAATLTAAGAAALEPARAALASAAALRQAVDDVNQVVRGRLSVGMVTACTVTPFFDALAAFHREHAGVDVVLSEGNSDRLVEQVRAGSLDLALVGTAGDPPAGLPSWTIIREGLVAAVPPDHPLAKRRRTTLAEATAHPIVALPVGTGIRTVFDDACREQAIAADLAFEASAPGAVADLAARGLGVAILSASMAGAFVDELRAVALRDVSTPAVLALVWGTGPNPAASALLDRCRRAFA